MPATIRLLSQTVTKNYSPYVFNKIATSRGPTQKRGTRVSTVKQSTRSTDTARCALGWHVMAQHCTVLPRTRTIRIAHAHFSDSISRPLGQVCHSKQGKFPTLPRVGGGGLTLIGALVLLGRSRLNSAQINVIHRTIIANFPRYRGKYVRACRHGCV